MSFNLRNRIPQRQLQQRSKKKNKSGEKENSFPIFQKK